MQAMCLLDTATPVQWFMATDNTDAVHHPPCDVFLFQITEVQLNEKRFNDFYYQPTTALT